jgi:hypothetical protein
MPTNKDRRPKVVKSRLLRLKKAETMLVGYRDLLSDSRAWLARADRIDPELGAKLFKLFEKERTAAEKVFAAQQSTAAARLPAKEVPIPVDWNRIPDIFLDRCQTFRGVTQTRPAVVSTPLKLSSDSDTEWGYEATSFDSPSGSYQSMMYKHWMRDKTHWYSVDAIDMMWVLSHFGYEFPAPQCNGIMNYEANLSMIVSAYISAETGLLSDELLVQEVADASRMPSAPATFEAYSRSFGMLDFVSTDFRTLNAVVTGSFRVNSGKKSRVWFGVSGICVALDGFAGTNGYCYLMVKPASGETQPGVKYTFVPD